MYRGPDKTQVARVRQLLVEWRFRPEPLEVASFTRREILLAAAEMQGQKAVSGYEHSLAFFELENLLPYLNRAARYITRAFPGHELFILGRDAELFYDALKILLAGTNREGSVRLFPGSTNFWTDLYPRILCEESCGPFPPSVLNDPLRLAFLRSFAITPENINRGQRYLVFDSGFYGTIAQLLHMVISRTFEGLLSPPSLYEVFQPYVFGTRDTAPAYAKQLITFKPKAKILRSSFPRVQDIKMASNKELPLMANFVLAIAFQLLPHHHEAYARLTRLPDGQVVALPHGPGRITLDIDAIRLSRNDSIVNPAAAMLVQKRVVDYFACSRSS